VRAGGQGSWSSQHLIPGVGLQGPRVLAWHTREPVHGTGFERDDRRLRLREDMQLDLIQVRFGRAASRRDSTPP
jgi:hypothetical protein